MTTRYLVHSTAQTNHKSNNNEKKNFLMDLIFYTDYRYYKSTRPPEAKPYLLLLGKQSKYHKNVIYLKELLIMTSEFSIFS